MATTVQVTFDCADPGQLAKFWCEALGYVIDPPPAGFASWPAALESWGVGESEWNSRSACSDPDGVGPRVFFQRVPESKVVKNRVHLDLRKAVGLDGDARMAALEAEADRLTALGATRLRRLEGNAMDGGIIVMADPEGNEFCLD